MKIVYERNIVDQLKEAISKAIRTGRVIKRFVLSSSEYNSLVYLTRSEETEAHHQFKTIAGNMTFAEVPVVVCLDEDTSTGEEG